MYLHWEQGLYVKKEEVNWISEHDLSKQGYQAVEANDSIYDLYGVPQFFHTLFEKIDQPEAGQQSGDGKLSPEEVVQANQDVPIRQQINRCLVKFHSEWFNQDNTSPAAQHYLEYINAPTSVAPAKAMAEHQLAMINKLSWLGDVLEQKKGLPESASERVWHMHPFMFGRVGQRQLITKEMINTLVKDKGNDEELLNEFAILYEVNTKFRIAHFLSQVAHESSFEAVREFTNYRHEILLGKIDTYRNYVNGLKEGETNRFLTGGTYLKQPDLFNFVYGDRMGNGDEASGDGYKYRGRGLIQLTGKNNYTKFTQEHNKNYPNDKQDFVKNYELIISNKRYTVESAFYYWNSRKINRAADKGVGESELKQITRMINGKYNGLDDRRAKLKKIMTYLNKIGMR